MLFQSKADISPSEKVDVEQLRLKRPTPAGPDSHSGNYLILVVSSQWQEPGSLGKSRDIDLK